MTRDSRLKPLVETACGLDRVAQRSDESGGSRSEIARHSNNISPPTCSDCGKGITQHSKTGRCRICALRAGLNDPASIARRAQASRNRMKDAAYREAAVARLLAANKAWRESPEGAAELSEMGRAAIRFTFTPEARAKWYASRPQACLKRTAKMLGDIPPEYWEAYRRLANNGAITRTRAKEMIRQRVANDRRAAAEREAERIAAMSPFERQLHALQNGARLVEMPAKGAFGR